MHDSSGWGVGSDGHLCRGLSRNTADEFVVVYDGENLGERLKKIESSDLDSLNDIWEAHKVRNRIAHEADYRMSPEDSAAAIGRFEKALRELEYI